MTRRWCMHSCCSLWVLRSPSSASGKGLWASLRASTRQAMKALSSGRLVEVKTVDLRVSSADMSRAFAIIIDSCSWLFMVINCYVNVLLCEVIVTSVYVVFVYVYSHDHSCSVKMTVIEGIKEQKTTLIRS